ncbi:MAG: hypothetical protein SVT56_00455, partial [Chloroflexota bacterium]|nr:hypothetical protein [Chloroflexota bacterium]
LKGDIWTIRIDEKILSWSYPRWPKSTGQIDLRLKSLKFPLRWWTRQLYPSSKTVNFHIRKPFFVSFTKALLRIIFVLLALFIVMPILKKRLK